jgi:glucan phosphoethanolaminetransferase (alkaline phosphatase superfamily)
VGVVILSTFGTVALGEYYAKQFFRAGLPRYSPANLVVYGIEYGRDAWRNRDIVVRDISLQFSLERVASRGSSEVVVIVIGESARVRNFQLAGYGRSTNPRLSRERDLIFFRDVTACRTHTVEAIPCLLTRLGAAELSIPVREVSLITILKRLGFDTKWLGMQGLGTRMQRRGNAVYRICQEAQLCKVSIKPNPYRDALDEDVLPSLRKSIAKRKQGRLLIVIHLLGSHAKYYARYPPEWAIYQPECKKAAFACGHDQVINSYDNSILYTDHVLGEAIELLRKEKAILFFTSDHGESLGELAIYGHGWPRVLAPEEQMKVPMAIWATPSFIADHQGEWARLHQAASRSTSHDYFFHTVLGCLGVQSPLLRSELNLCGQQEMAKR